MTNDQRVTKARLPQPKRQARDGWSLGIRHWAFIGHWSLTLYDVGRPAYPDPPDAGHRFDNPQREIYPRRFWAALSPGQPRRAEAQRGHRRVRHPPAPARYRGSVVGPPAEDHRARGL